MPDVKMYMHVSLRNKDLQDRVPEIVAEQMSCRVGGKFYRLAVKEIDLMIFCYNENISYNACDLKIVSQTDIIVEVAAYDFEDRMANIDERIFNIATGVGALYDSEPAVVTVSITFIPIKQGHWVKV